MAMQTDWIETFIGAVAPHLKRVTDSISGGEDSPGTLRRAAWFAAVAGDKDAASHWLLAAASHPDDRGEASFAMGLLHLARDEHEAARTAFVLAAEAQFSGPPRDQAIQKIRAYDPAVNRFAVFRIFYNAFEHRFCCFLLPRKVKPAEQQDYAFCFARVVNELRPVPAWLPVLEQERQLNSDSMWYWLALGHVHWIAGRRDEADTAYRQCRNRAIEQQIIPYHFDCGAMVWLKRSEVEALLSPGDPPGLMSTAGWRYTVMPRPLGREPKLVFVLGVDQRYFVFFPKFLLSVVQSMLACECRHPAAVHVHVADPLPQQVAFLDAVAVSVPQAVPDLSVSFSTGPAAFKDPSYYTCLRYLVMPEVLARYPCGAMALDVDSLLAREFFDRLPEITSFDFALRMYNFSPQTGEQSGGEPWSIGAHPTYVANTPLGRDFARLMRNYVSAAYDPALPTNWTVDQCALAQAYHLLVRGRPDCRVLNIAHYPQVYHLPHEFGGKQGLLDFGGPVTMANFHQLLARAVSTSGAKP